MSGVVLDLFAGPGGWSEGLRQLGYSDFGIEWDATACDTRYAAGHASWHADVEQVDPAMFDDLDVWGVIASPPCPDWSQAGRRAGIGGDSGRLIWEPMRFVSRLAPAPKREQEDDPDVHDGPLWFACRHPERPFDGDTVLHDCCRACLLAAQVAIARGYLPNTEDGGPLLAVLVARLDEYGEAPE